MILDSLNEFCDAVSVAAAAGTTLIGNQIDLTAAGAEFGDDLYLVITVDTAIFTGGAAGSLQFKLASDSTAAISTTTSSVHLLTPPYVTGASPGIAAGTVLFVCELPKGAYVPYEEFLGILSVVGTTTITSGKVNAFLTNDPTAWKAYQAAI